MPNTTNFNWTTPADTDLVKDGALAIRTLANGIDTSLVDLKGGTTGQVLAKATNTDLDFSWVAQDDSNAIQNAIIDAKGDLIVGTAADTPARLAVGGTNGHVLTVDSAEASGMKWAAVAGGAGNMAQIATGTLSGASVVISGLSTYSEILVAFYETTNNTAGGIPCMRLNATSSNHANVGFYMRNDGTAYGRYISISDDKFLFSSQGVLRTSTDNVYTAKLTNCKTTGFTDVDIKGMYLADNNSQKAFFLQNGVYTNNETISSITLFNNGGNWSAGTYYVWGA